MEPLEDMTIMELDSASEEEDVADDGELDEHDVHAAGVHDAEDGTASSA